MWVVGALCATLGLISYGARSHRFDLWLSPAPAGRGLETMLTPAVPGGRFQSAVGRAVPRATVQPDPPSDMAAQEATPSSRSGTTLPVVTRALSVWAMVWGFLLASAMGLAKALSKSLWQTTSPVPALGPAFSCSAVQGYGPAAVPGCGPSCPTSERGVALSGHAAAESGVSAVGPRVLNGLREIAAQYDIVLFDQYGVLHDGEQPLPGVLDTLHALQDQRKAMVVVSNTANRAKSAADKYLRLGLPPVMAGFITSGEVTWRHLQQQCEGQSCVYVARQNYETESYRLSEVGVSIADSAANADFVLLHGTQIVASGAVGQGTPIGVWDHGPVALREGGHPDTSAGDARLQEVLRDAAARGLPALCANPDFVAINAAGVALHMPGLIAAEYEALGGAVTRFGKPSLEHFAAAVAAATPALPACTAARAAPRVLHVGDSVHHDIAGAAAAGIDSVLITRFGVHKEVLHGAQTTPELLQQNVMDLCDGLGLPCPTYILQECCW